MRDEDRTQLRASLDIIGYRLDDGDSEILYLRRPDGWPVATFSAGGATREGVEEAARGDHRRRQERPQ